MPWPHDSEPTDIGLPLIDIYEEEGIYVYLDEGCNSNCHGRKWAIHVATKLDKLALGKKLIGSGFAWVSHKKKKFHGIGGCKVNHMGKRRVTTVARLMESRKSLPGLLESREQDGRHPLLLSDNA